MNMLSPSDAYRLWAPTYADETAISHLENELVASLTPPAAGMRLLDAGCGTGRRLHGTGAASAVGVDLSPEMLDAGIGRALPAAGVTAIIGDIRALPLANRAFDLIWCRLAIGHLRDCRPAYAELARVADRGARLIVTDFHPRAHRAGHRRTFRTGNDVHEVEHHVHPMTDHLAAGRAAGLELIEVKEAAIGPGVRHFYDNAGRASLYDEHAGLPVVIAFSFRRDG